MKEPLFFYSIPIQTPIKAIYSRLGYRKEFTKVENKHRDMVEGYIEDALDIIELKGSAIIVPIEKIDETSVRLLSGEVFVSNSLAKMLASCHEMVLMCATAGTGIMDTIKEDASGKDITRGVVLDATASEMVDACLDWIMVYFNQMLKRRSKKLTTRRFSAGYGDLDLKNQGIIYELLKMDRLGVSITESFILIPEKSVTAIAGVEM